MDSIGSIIDTCLQKRTKKNYWQIKLIENYHKIVGSIIAKNTKLLYFNGKRATIICRNSIWMNELKNREEQIIEKMNQYIGKNIVESLQVKIGNIEKPSVKQSKKTVALTKEEEAWIEETMKLVPETLQDRFRSLLVSYKELKK